MHIKGIYIMALGNGTQSLPKSKPHEAPYLSISYLPIFQQQYAYVTS
jgi:hypothetical protein